MNSKCKRWQSAFPKPLLVLFIVQVLLSAACISTANAGAMSMSMDANAAPIMAHCHSDSVSMHSSSDMPACSHCDTTDMGLSAHISNHVDMIPVLLAIIVLPEVPALSISTTGTQIAHVVLPNSSSLLYQISQRILI
ncbi:MAG: hypothetical protein Q9M14_04180 [Mariprofundaceae bacterium]|nr:hypothetical protein [Mariprofundaceae bacterium]